MPQNLPPVEGEGETWLAYWVKEGQTRQNDVNKELLRSIEGLAKRLSTLERRVDRLYTILYTAVPILQIVGNLGIGILVKVWE